MTLTDLINENETSKIVMNYLAKRQRATQVTRLNALRRDFRRKGIKVNYDDFNRVWTNLSRLGYGDIELGLNGEPKSFYWKGVNFITVAKEAMAIKEGTSHISDKFVRLTPQEKEKFMRLIEELVI